MKCDLEKKDSCQLFNNFKDPITAMQAMPDGYVYAGINNGQLMRCVPQHVGRERRALFTSHLPGMHF